MDGKQVVINSRCCNPHYWFFLSPRHHTHPHTHFHPYHHTYDALVSCGGRHIEGEGGGGSRRKDCFSPLGCYVRKQFNIKSYLGAVVKQPDSVVEVDDQV